MSLIVVPHDCAAHPTYFRRLHSWKTWVTSYNLLQTLGGELLVISSSFFIIIINSLVPQTWVSPLNTFGHSSRENLQNTFAMISFCYPQFLQLWGEISFVSNGHPVAVMSCLFEYRISLNLVVPS